MEQAVAKPFEASVETVQKDSMTINDIGEVAAILRAEGSEHLLQIGFKVFRPVKIMLAQMANSVDEALREHEGKTAFEYKYDGARVQIHKLGNKTRIFTRRLTDTTRSLPEVVETVMKNVKAEEAILEGEVIAIDKLGYPAPFQHLMRRFKRINKIKDTAAKILVKLYLFDLLYLNGKSLVTLPYLQRRQILAKNAGEIPLTKQLITDKKEEAQQFLNDAMNTGHEGLIAKKLDSPYRPGIRGKGWFKIKPVLEPLDLIIVAAEYGFGGRHKWLSDYYLATRDGETGELLTVGKTFKGLTDAEIIEMTRRLKELIVTEESRRAVVVPKIVVESNIQRDPEKPKIQEWNGFAVCTDKPS